MALPLPPLRHPLIPARAAAPPVYRPVARPRVAPPAGFRPSAQVQQRVLVPPRAPLPPPVFRPAPVAASPALQLKKASKREREARKQQQKRINVRTQTQGAFQGIHAEASKGSKRYVGQSGNGATVMAELAGVNTPWKGLTKASVKPFEGCAEADIYRQLYNDSENPKQYDLISYNAQGVPAPPCANCAQWVTSTFKSVASGTKTYRSKSKHTGA